MSGRTVSVYGDFATITEEDATDEETCRDCRWWTVAVYEHEPYNDSTCGYCRRFPPCCEIMDTDNDGHGQRLMGYPMCYAGNEICGEFIDRGW